MWRLPVTFGGGITMQNGGRARSVPARNKPRSTHSRDQRSSIASGRYSFSISIGDLGGAVRPHSKETKGALARVALELADPLADDDLREIGHDVPRNLANHAVGQPLDDADGDRVDVGGRERQ